MWILLRDLKSVISPAPLKFKMTWFEEHMKDAKIDIIM